MDEVTTARGARGTTDPATLARVAEMLRAQLAGTLPLLLRERVNARGEPMERRTVTPLRRQAP